MAEDGVPGVDRPIRYISLFSGIEAASVAWEDMGWECVAVADFDKFPSAVLAHRFPDVPNLGDITKVDWNAWKGKADVVVGGSPCQSFSIAGKRLGLDDPRGNLAIEYLRVVEAVQPRWFLYENVAGLLSSDGGRDFGAFLGLVGELGYGWAYRILDAQFFGVPQRRRRVFVVGGADGDWRGPASVLFERESLCGHPPQGAQATKTDSSEARSGPRTPIGFIPDDGRGSGGDGSDGRGMKDGYASHDEVADPVMAGWAKTADIPQGSRDAHGNMVVEDEKPVAFKVRLGPEHAGWLDYVDKTFTIATTQDQQLMIPVEGDDQAHLITGGGTYIGSEKANTMVAREGHVSNTGHVAIQPADEALALQASGDRANPSQSISEGVAFTLPANPMSDRGQSVAQPIPIQDATEREKHQHGAGVGEEGQASYTLQAFEQHGVAQPVDDVTVFDWKNITQTRPSTEATDPVTVNGSLAVESFVQGNPETLNTKTTATVVADGMGYGNISNAVLSPTDTEDAEEPVLTPLDCTASSDETGRANTLVARQGNLSQQDQVVVHETREVFAQDKLQLKTDVIGTIVAREGGATDTSHGVLETQGVDLYNQEFTGDKHPPLRTAGGHGAPAVFTEGEVEPDAPYSFEPRHFTRGERGGKPVEDVRTLSANFVGNSDAAPHLLAGSGTFVVRRLTPIECERLQGFPDNWTRIPWNGKDELECPDSHRYKACGNSMAVPVMRWIGQGIDHIQRTRPEPESLDDGPARVISSVKDGVIVTTDSMDSWFS